tara:strand:+ start:371 stop:535 length:165 start_codon:yes stop_codon:yes gene_type:complete
MAIKYKLGESGFVFKIDTDKPNLHHNISLASKENYDTVEYQAWVDAGNTPEAAD